MQYATLGRTGLIVSRLCLGTVTFGPDADEPVAHAILDRAFEAGVNFIDTANTYNKGLAETYIGTWMKDKRPQIVINSKVGNPIGPGVLEHGLSAKHLVQEVEASLRRLRTDYIDTYQLHHPDPNTPLETSLRALDDLVRQGKVRYAGCSNHPAWQVCKGLWISDKRNWARFEVVQPWYSLLAREIEHELLPLCAEEQIGVIPYNPLAGGFLTGKYQRGQELKPGVRFGGVQRERYTLRYWYDCNFDVVDRLRVISERSGKSLAHLALGWVLANPVITSAIVGARIPQQVAENVAFVDQPLTADEYAACTKASQGGKAVEAPVKWVP